MFVAERNRHANGRVPVNNVAWIHQAVVAASTADFNGENTFVRFDLDQVEAFLGTFDYISDVGRFNLRAIREI